MYPVMIDPDRIGVVLAGTGAGVLARLQGLDGAGLGMVKIFSPDPDQDLSAAAGDRLHRRLPEGRDFDGAGLVFISGLDDGAAEALVHKARRRHIPVNVEDRKQWCDFHVPAVLRRGDLLLTVSTAGRCPGLAVRIRDHLATLFGPEWAERLFILGEARDGWRRQGADMATLGNRTKEWIDRKGWFR